MDDRPTTPQAVAGLPRLLWLSLFGGSCLVAGGIALATGAGLPCPTRAATGLLCPLCGGSGMGLALFRGDVLAAWRWNPYALVLVVVLAALWGWTGMRLITGRPAGLPGFLGWVDRLSVIGRVALVVAPGLAYMVVRNLL